MHSSSDSCVSNSSGSCQSNFDTAQQHINHAQITNTINGKPKLEAQLFFSYYVPKAMILNWQPASLFCRKNYQFLQSTQKFPFKPFFRDS